ncbi:PREDICTED: solute carrier family 13 member 2-like [Priapulus caudatus]|uniref:Solute carrier family 13 member 2-like n=1 Tax=Priapulus caudatus TaxID=37621 RepID=A0ABM1F2A6_PRICU|nr:PREDICTED: solute carrier family 13 member 2-like [Priapulus caudatus]
MRRRIPLRSQASQTDIYDSGVELNAKLEQSLSYISEVSTGVPDDQRTPEDHNLAKGMLIAIAYGASAGGTATLTGTPPNLVMSGLIEQFYGDAAGVNFATWFFYSAPSAVIILVIIWLWLQLYFLGWRTLFGCFIKGRDTADKTVEAVIKEEYTKLGNMT